MKIARGIMAGLFSGLMLLFPVFTGKISEWDWSDKRPPNKGILTVWEIDSFEGGVGSRAQYLLKVGRAFEKESGYATLVKTLSADGARELLKEGKRPDVLSCGVGLDVSPTTKIEGVRSPAGTVSGSVYAAAWARGAYAVFYAGNGEKAGVLEKAVVSSGKENAVSAAVLLSGFTAKTLALKTPINAYYDFVTGITPVLFGTQRDAHRLLSRGFLFTVDVVTAFNDLYQYVYITAPPEKADVAAAFTALLLSEKWQRGLTEIGLFSPYFGGLYDSGVLCDMERATYKETLSAFLGETGREALETVLKTATDKKDAEKLKKFLVRLD